MSDLPDSGDKPRQPAATTVAHDRVPQSVGASIGSYRLMEKIGEGGFGVVFVAEQQSPVKRKVALKLIKPGMDSREVIARFEAERQALALMDHANIARVLDAGTTESGHPYFVMELVRGVPITDYCDQHRLTLRERLELFISVCQAVQHAHQKGIIHRDIKPSNVLVTLHDGVPVVKVIDFGVAKALHQQLTEKTIYTRFAQVIGTPLYMSPEQAEMSGLDIDTRSDIYSLGVLLYELLTGTTPFDGKRLAKVAFDERIRIIRHEEPPKPSTRLRQSCETLPSIAAQRRIEPAKLSKLFRGDLDWITMKALEKERTRRYETASALAADVGRYLRDEPVEASPPSTTYLLKKFARRHRTYLATAAAFVALLLAGVVVSTGFAFREARARDLAERLRQREADARQVAETQRQRADENAQNAKNEAQKARLAQLAAELAGQAEAAARKSAQAALERSERSLYFSSIALVERNWQANNPKRAGEILDACSKKLRDWEWDYLQRLVHPEVMVLEGQNAVYSPDGELLATAGNEKEESISIRNARSGKFVMSLQGGRPIPLLRSLAFSPDSRRLAAICRDGALRIWILPSGRQAQEVRVRLSEETLHDPLSHPVDLAYSPDGKRIAIAGVASEKINKAGVKPDELVIWDPATGKQMLTVPDTGLSVAFSPDGKQLATSSAVFVKDSSPVGWVGPFTDGIRLLDVRTGDVKTQFPAWSSHGTDPSAHAVGADDSQITYSPDGKWLASARGSEIKVWDAITRKEIQTLRGHLLRVNSLSFSPDGKSLASASEDETVRIWDLNTGAPIIYRGHVGAVWAVAVRPDGKCIASTGRDGTVRIWNLKAKQGPLEIPMRTVNRSIGLSPDLRSASYLQPRRLNQYDLVLMDLSSGRQSRLRSCTPTVQPVHASLVFTADGRLLASALEKEIEVWDVGTGQARASFVGLANMTQRGLAFSPEGDRLAFIGPPNSVEIWSLQDHRRLAIYKGHRGAVTAIVFSPRGDRVATGSTDETVKIWDSSTGEEIRNLKGSPSAAASLAFSPDGRCLLASGPDNSVLVWDLERGSEVRTLRGHKSLVTSIAFNPTGTRVATAGQDSVIRLWTWPECEEILSLPAPMLPVVARFAVDGKKLAAAGDHGVTVWDAAARPPADPAQE